MPLGVGAAGVEGAFGGGVGSPGPPVRVGPELQPTTAPHASTTRLDLRSIPGSLESADFDFLNDRNRERLRRERPGYLERRLLLPGSSQIPAVVPYIVGPAA